MPIDCRGSVGAQLGWIAMDFDGYYALRKCSINKIVTYPSGSKYYSNGLYKPVSSKEVDPNTEQMETSDLIFLDEIFVLTDITKPKAERWVKWANEDPERVREFDLFSIDDVEEEEIDDNEAGDFES